MRAREAAIDFVHGSLAPSDLAAVATFSQAGIQVLLSFTTDRSQLARAISALGVMDTQRLRDPLSIAYDLGVDRWGPGIGAPSDNEWTLRQMAQLMSRSEQTLYRQRVDGFLAGLAQLARVLDAVQGRKQVILLSAGFDSSVLGGAQGQEAAEAAQAAADGRLWEVHSDRYFGDSVTRDSLDRLFRSLAATDTVIHTVDVGGLAAAGAVDQAVPGRLARDGTPWPSSRPTPAASSSRTRTISAAAWSSCSTPAATTTCSRSSLSKREEAGPPAQARGPREGQRARGLPPQGVRHPGSEAGRRAGSRTAPGRGDDRQGALGRADRAARRRRAVPRRQGHPLVARGPGDRRTDAARGRGLEAAAARGVRLRIRRRGTHLRRLGLGAHRRPGGGQAGPRGQGAPGAHLLRGARGTGGPALRGPEKTTGRAGSLRVRLEMPAFEAGTVVLSPPLAMDDPRTRLVLPAASRALPASRSRSGWRTRRSPSSRSPSCATAPARRLCDGLGRREALRRGPAYEVEADLLDAAGEARGLPLAGPPRVVPDADGLERYVLTLAPRDVPPGRYALRVLFRDPATGAIGRSELAVQIE